MSPEVERSYESLIGKSPWAVLGEIWRANPQIDVFYFCAIDPRHYLERQKNNPNPLLQNPPLAYGELSKHRPLGVLDPTLVGGRIHFELLLECGALPFLKNKLKENKMIEGIEELVREEREKYILAVMSGVKLDDGSFRHVPMIDFSTSGVGHDLPKARDGLRKIGERKGFILDSGRGLHYFGINLLSEKEWPKFVGRCLLLNLWDVRIIDHRFMGHRLIDGYACLRITDHSTKPFAPKVVDIFENLESPATPETAEDDFLTREKEWEARIASGEPLFRF